MKQLALSLAPSPKAARVDLKWLDVTAIAAGVGFTTKVLISVGLSNALEPITTEANGDYDQRLYEVLWLAHFQLTRDQIAAATFNFIFPHKPWIGGELTDASLRLRAETRDASILIGLLEDF